jgi:hypothetical protein
MWSVERLAQTRCERADTCEKVAPDEDLSILPLRRRFHMQCNTAGPKCVLRMQLQASPGNLENENATCMIIESMWSVERLAQTSTRIEIQETRELDV